jgi:hypothetical protein
VTAIEAVAVVIGSLVGLAIGASVSRETFGPLAILLAAAYTLWCLGGLLVAIGYGICEGECGGTGRQLYSATFTAGACLVAAFFVAAALRLARRR